MPSEKGAALLCMSEYMWENVYGLEDAEESGEVLLPDVVSTQTKGYGLKVSEALKDPTMIHVSNAIVGSSPPKPAWCVCVTLRGCLAPM